MVKLKKEWQLFWVVAWLSKPCRAPHAIEYVYLCRHSVYQFAFSGILPSCANHIPLSPAYGSGVVRSGTKHIETQSHR